MPCSNGQIPSETDVFAVKTNGHLLLLFAFRMPVRIFQCFMGCGDGVLHELGRASLFLSHGQDFPRYSVGGGNGLRTSLVNQSLVLHAPSSFLP